MGDLKTREYVLTYVKPDSSCVIAEPKLLLAQGHLITWKEPIMTRVRMMMVGRFVVLVLRSSLPAVLSMSITQSIEATSRHVKKGNVHPWASY